MSNEVERQSRRRRVLLMIMASGFLVWQIPSMDLFARLADGASPVARAVSLAGLLIWAAGLVFLLSKSRYLVRKASAQERAALEDELVQANRARAFSAGYWAMLVAAGALFAAHQYWPLSGGDIAQLVLMAGVAVPLYAFAILERVNA